MKGRIKGRICLFLVALMLTLNPIQVLAEDVSTVESNSKIEETVDSDNQNSEESLLQAEQSDINEEETEAGQEQKEHELETTVVSSKKIEYAFVENTLVASGAEENVIISILEKSAAVESAQLSFLTPSGSEQSVEMSNYLEGAFLFKLETNGEYGIYKLTRLVYVSGGISYDISLQDEEIDASFEVCSQEEYDAAQSQVSADADTAVQIIDENGEMKEVASLEEGLAIVDNQEDSNVSTYSIEDGISTQAAADTGNIVVVLDPGHDNQHPGAAGNGINEEEYTLQIAKACRDELQQYPNVDVYMTVEENGDSRWITSTTTECLNKRVQYAKELNADLFVSLHLNSVDDSSSTNGAEVYVSGYSKYKEDGLDLGNRVLQELEKLGLSITRGVKIQVAQSLGTYDDGTLADYYSVIRNSTYAGFPSALVEHAFITNSSDASIIKNKTQELGQADAKAIAEHLKLEQGPYSVSEATGTVVGNTVKITVNPKAIDSAYNQYRFMCYDGEKWSDNSFSSSTSFEWKPTKVGNNYILGIEAKNSSGDVIQFIKWQFYSVAEPSVELSGVDVLESDNGMTVEMSPQIKTNSKSIKYRYQIYSYDKGYWKTLADNSIDTSYKWTPEHSGTYWLHIVAITASGKEYETTIVYVVDKGRARIDSFHANIERPVIGEHVNLTASCSVLNDEEYTYQFMAYDGKFWKDITGTGGKTTVWVPSITGDHLLCYQITSKSTGETFQSFISTYVEKPQTQLNGLTTGTMNDKGEIRLSADISTNDKNLKYTFKAYDMSTWITLESDTASSEITWKPDKSGSYLLYLEVNDSNKEVHTGFAGYAVPDLVSIKEFHADKTSPQVLGKEIALSASAAIADSLECTYQYMYYDGKGWHSIDFSNTLKSVKWKPEKAGDYLLCFQVMTKKGEAYQNFMSYTIESPSIELQEIGVSKPDGSGNVKLQANIKTNYDDLKYTFKAYDMDKWKDIVIGSSNNYVQWKPQKAGSYLLYLEVKTPLGKVYTKFTGCTIVDDVTMEGLSFSKTSPQVQGTGIGIKGSVSALFPENLRYEYMAYDGVAWKYIAFANNLDEITWVPEKAGNYLICFQAVQNNGERKQLFQYFNIEQAYVQVNDISVGEMNSNGEVRLQANIKTNQSGLKYSYKAYDMEKWSDIILASDKDYVVWKPKKQGSYLLYLEVETKEGQKYTQFAGCTIPAFFSVTGLGFSKESPQVANSTIEISGEAQSSFAKGLRYDYMVYDGATWKYIQCSYELKAASWKPESAGTYLICFQAVEPDGECKQVFQYYTIEKPNVNITSFTITPGSPQQYTSDLSVELFATVASNLQGLKYRYIYYDNVNWNFISESRDIPQKATWKPKSAGNYLLCFQVETQDGIQYNEFRQYAISDDYYIMGQSSVSVSQMVNFFKKNNSNYDVYTKVNGYNGSLARGGANTIEAYCQMFLEEARAEGVKADVAFCQAMVETGFLQYGGDVKPDQYNFAGLGATGGVPGNRFSSVREGIRAQIQHLKCYASTEPLNNVCVDPRWWDALRGTAPTVEMLSAKWATNAQYGKTILDLIARLKQEA